VKNINIIIPQKSGIIITFGLCGCISEEFYRQGDVEIDTF